MVVCSLVPHNVDPPMSVQHLVVVWQCGQWRTNKLLYIDDGHLDWLQRLQIIIPYFWFCLERVAWIHFCSSSGLPLLGLVLCAGGVIISSPCPVWEWSFSSVYFLGLWCLFLLLPLVILETLFYGRKQFSASVLPQDKYWSLTIMQQPSLWDALLEKRLTAQDRSRRNRFNQTAWQNQAQYSFQILMTSCVIGVQSNSQEMTPSANASY